MFEGQIIYFLNDRISSGKCSIPAKSQNLYLSLQWSKLLDPVIGLLSISKFWKMLWWIFYESKYLQIVKFETVETVFNEVQAQVNNSFNGLSGKLKQLSILIWPERSGWWLTFPFLRSFPTPTKNHMRRSSSPYKGYYCYCR